MTVIVVVTNLILNTIVNRLRHLFPFPLEILLALLDHGAGRLQLGDGLGLPVDLVAYVGMNGFHCQIMLGACFNPSG